ncbi:NAD(+) diphosphatase [Cellulomonas shaoxiangyii]|uniref:NAD(+) diphosphatase n=1 Tax=Cellulomonas shaoxiangyii TaxID=2566013 RepID=A0A4P7SH79_9CELL|nr:NAD(+) diphosphatase [Cellulomonas shaoxiangyii]QCB93041.1 NAD(+) diphosphatase [Cellulomonas shaoxiangyii]TGY84690.1 NAD(+) diphosphatase [Cellulomonas shaoxiangyii]
MNPELLVDLPLARSRTDRAALLRAEPEAVPAALADPRTRVLVVRDGGIRTDGPAGVRWYTVADVRAEAEAVLGVDAVPLDAWLLLGAEDDGARVLALRLPDHAPVPAGTGPADAAVHAPAGATRAGGAAGTGDGWASLRVVGAALDARDAGLATTAVALDAWHDRHPRCPRCGAPTRVAQAGWSRVCDVDGSEHYPRTDPAVIMAVVDDADRLLLGHAATWPEGRYSTLAGFVEAGESAEQAVRREVREETDVVVDRVEYRGSQPWPFPGSLMLGYRAHAVRTNVTVDGQEVTAARWYTRAELTAAVRAGTLLLPGRASIARALVEEWFGGRIEA